MARGFSKVILMGNLTRDIEVRTTASGQNVANFTLAVTRTWRNQNGQNQDQTSFINGNTTPAAASANSGSGQDVVIEDIDDKPIDLSEIPF